MGFTGVVIATLVLIIFLLCLLCGAASIRARAEEKYQEEQNELLHKDFPYGGD